MNCPSNQLGFSLEPMLSVSGSQGAGFRNIGIRRRPGVGQFESKRLSAIRAILARVTATGLASGVGFWEGPASLYTTTSPQRTAQPET